MSLTGFKALSTGFQILSTEFQTLSTKFQIHSKSGPQIQGSTFIFPTGFEVQSTKFTSVVIHLTNLHLPLLMFFTQYLATILFLDLDSKTESFKYLRWV